VAACVSICPGVESIFEWEGEMTTAQEVLLVIKTTKAQVASLKTTIDEEHPYEVPELLVTPAIDGLSDYLEWVRKATSFGS
jgi:periplasmic divalent cation tolerance protein